jgi:hypothetical protein
LSSRRRWKTATRFPPTTITTSPGRTPFSDRQLMLRGQCYDCYDFHQFSVKASVFLITFYVKAVIRVKITKLFFAKL